MAHSFRDAGFDLKHPRIATYLELSMRIQDLPRHLGHHSGGMVICQSALDAVVPLERAAMPRRTVVQWDKDDFFRESSSKRTFGTNNDDRTADRRLFRNRTNG